MSAVSDKEELDELRASIHRTRLNIREAQGTLHEQIEDAAKRVREAVERGKVEANRDPQASPLQMFAALQAQSAAAQQAADQELAAIAERAQIIATRSVSSSSDVGKAVLALAGGLGTIALVRAIKRRR